MPGVHVWIRDRNERRDTVLRVCRGEDGCERKSVRGLWSQHIFQCNRSECVYGMLGWIFHELLVRSYGVHAMRTRNGQGSLHTVLGWIRRFFLWIRMRTMRRRVLQHGQLFERVFSMRRCQVRLAGTTVVVLDVQQHERTLAESRSSFLQGVQRRIHAILWILQRLQRRIHRLFSGHELLRLLQWIRVRVCGRFGVLFVCTRIFRSVFCAGSNLVCVLSSRHLFQHVSEHMHSLSSWQVWSRYGHMHNLSCEPVPKCRWQHRVFPLHSMQQHERVQLSQLDGNYIVSKLHSRQVQLGPMHQLHQWNLVHEQLVH